MCSPDAPSPSDPNQLASQGFGSILGFGPQFLAQDVNAINALAQAASNAQMQYGIPLFQAQLAAYQQAFPEQFAAQKAAQQQVSSILGGPGLTQEQQDFFGKNFAAKEAAAGRLGSSVGSFNVSRDLLDLALGQQNFATQAGLGIPTLNPGFSQVTGIGSPASQ